MMPLAVNVVSSPDAGASRTRRRDRCSHLRTALGNGAGEELDLLHHGDGTVLR
jgi:hypothetical protein